MSKYLLTGSNGFLGNVIHNYLKNEYEVYTTGRSGTDYNYDLSLTIPEFNGHFDIVIHAAGKAHYVPENKKKGEIFALTNIIGTQNLLQGLDKMKKLPSTFVFISTVAVYGMETGNLINENTLLKAADPYGQSKIKAEQIVQEWCTTNNVICTILRLPLIAGVNPPGNLKRMINGIANGYYLNIKKGKAKRSVVLAIDVAKIIPTVALIGGTYNLTDGYHPSFAELSELIAKQLNKKRPFNIPYLIARPVALVGDVIGDKSPINSDKLKKITSDLTFDDSKARKLLGWEPTPVLKGFNIYQ